MNTAAAATARPTCCAGLPSFVKCNKCRKADTSNNANANRAALADYLANGPLGAEKVAKYDAAARA